LTLENTLSLKEMNIRFVLAPPSPNLTVTRPLVSYADGNIEAYQPFQGCFHVPPALEIRELSGKLGDDGMR
jgi:hypothetical protein